MRDPAEPVHSGMLRAQIQIDATRRRYDADEQARLRDLFGEPERWSTTLKSMLWTHVTVVVAAVRRRRRSSTCPCRARSISTSRRRSTFTACRTGDVPLSFLFSGTVFYEAGHERTLVVAPVPWDKEARFRLPVQTWHALMDHYYPNSAWLRLRRDTFERLSDFKRRHGIPTWEEAIERMLPADEPVGRS